MSHRTVSDAFAASAAKHPDKPFLIIAADGATQSYAQVAVRVAALRQRYRAAGYGHGHRVALSLEMRPDFFHHYLALNGLGVGIVPINPDYRHDELAWQMEHSEAALAVAVPAQLPKFAALPLPAVDALALPPELPRPAAAPPRGDPPGPDSECGLLYTSGTTGRPKGCVLTNFYYLNAGAWYRDMGGMIAFREGAERFYNPLPLYHMNHQAVTATCAILTASALILPERFSPQRWWPEVSANRATVVHYLGVVPPLLLNQAETADEKRHCVRFGIGAGVEPELHGAFERRFGFPLIEVWGMTETGRIFADHVEPRRIDTRAFGRPLGEFEARVADEQDREVPRGQEGELLVRCAGADPRRGFFAGYLKNEAATSEAWRGGWFHTGDVVRQSADGMLTFVDRKKNIIRRAGENIAAAEIEACLQAHPEVAQVAVLAGPDELREEEVFACIVPMPGVAAGAALAERLFAHAMAGLAYYKAPGWLLFVETLPTTGTQKVQKTQIFAAGEDPRRRPGAIDLRQRKKRSAA